MATRPVHWEEGMFLRPQHLQAAGRFEAQRRQLYSRASTRYNWGLVSLGLNKDALKNHRFEVLHLRALLRDGTYIDLPNDGPVPAADFRGPIEQASPHPLMEWFGVPTMQQGRPNATDGPGDRRFVLESLSIEDENAQGDPQPIRFRLVNSKFFLDNAREQGGYDVLPVARLKRSSDANGTPVLDEKYIPPILSCDAWEPLQVQILRSIMDRVGNIVGLLAEQVVSRGISIESSHAEDARIVAQLRALNEAYTVLNVIAFIDGVHPADAYLELCRLIGQLSIYAKDARPPAIPAYDHDDLGFVFWRLKELLDVLLDIRGPEYESKPFKVVIRDTKPHLQVDLKPTWLEGGWLMFVGVRSSFDVNQMRILMTDANLLDMKLASAERADDLSNRGFRGLEFRHVLRPPLSLPNAPDLSYFEISPQGRMELWDEVRRSNTLALRLNPTKLDNPTAGQTRLTLKPLGSMTSKTIELTLFVVRTR